MSRFLFLVNPVAGGGKALSYTPMIEKAMTASKLDYKVLNTNHRGDATSLVVSNPDFDVVVAVGGDGTVNETARGILERGNGILGIIPGGTGNDMSRALGISEDPEESIDTLLKGSVKEVDIGTVDGRYFFNVASLGLDTEVVRHTEKIRKVIKGKIAYILGVITALVVYRSRETKIDVDGLVINRKTALVAVGNGSYYGGGMMILPMSKVDDGKLDICVVKNVSNLRILSLFPTIFKGKHVKYTKYVEFHKADRVAVTVASQCYLNVDGELFKIDPREVVFSLSKEHLKAIC